jgi:hypothetical protein
MGVSTNVAVLLFVVAAVEPGPWLMVPQEWSGSQRRFAFSNGYILRHAISPRGCASGMTSTVSKFLPP